MLLEGIHMDPNSESQDVSYLIIAALLQDVHNVHGLVFNTRSLRLTTNVVERRFRREGIGFLTKTLLRLGKAFDKALSGDTTLNYASLGFKTQANTELPRFLGEFFNRVFHPNGEVLSHPCSDSVRVIRQICFAFSKYKLPYSDEQEQQVIDQFKKTEQDITTRSAVLQEIEATLNVTTTTRRAAYADPTIVQVAHGARSYLNQLFATFDPKDIYPRHGPGTVATKQRLHEKYLWSNVSSRITDMYPFDAYFCASAGHVCDTYDSFSTITQDDLPARVILVPKDSRGPRLISCEPVDFQWIQQGLGRSIVELVESHPISKWNVHFTDQSPNRVGALLGSIRGGYATLDLKEASDRVSVDLVRLLFPSHVYTYLEACRSSSTELPDGGILPLKKFAPMGSCLCFPIMALTIWAILMSAAPDAYTRERILVYGDDVIVPTAYAENAIKHLESFGLLINRDKSCIKGLFRESCGMDAFKGIDVTPVRFRTVWSSLRSPDVYTSWISYANSLYDRQYLRTYDLIVGLLVNTYGPIPDEDMFLTCPSLRKSPCDREKFRRRWNTNLQRLEYRVLDVKSPTHLTEIKGWSMLLRFFAEKGVGHQESHVGSHHGFFDGSIPVSEPFSVRSYTSRRCSMLQRRWR
jgi:hypothetical protein